VIIILRRFWSEIPLDGDADSEFIPVTKQGRQTA
jgi:hypothetical protein